MELAGKTNHRSASRQQFRHLRAPRAWVGGAGVMIDRAEKNPERRFKMMYLAQPTGKSSSLQSGVAYSADGVRWKPDPRNPLIPTATRKSRRTGMLG